MNKKQVIIFFSILSLYSYIYTGIGNFTYGYLPRDKKAALLESLFKNENHPHQKVVHIHNKYKGIYFDHVKKISGSIPDRTIDIYIACLNKHCGDFLKIIHSTGKRRENISYHYGNIANDILHNELDKNPREYFNYIKSFFENTVDENEKHD